jgi:hypothetical protein
MISFKDFIKQLPETKGYETLNIYKASINPFQDSWVFLFVQENQDKLLVSGRIQNEFEGESFVDDGLSYKIAPLTHANANALRLLFPFTKPISVLDKPRSFGLGDRLGIAGKGHLQIINNYDCYPVLAQQSIRELNMTNRSYEDVLDKASFSVFREGYKKGFGADGDHLKTASDIEYALSLGFTMITLDCSEHIRDDVLNMSVEQIIRLTNINSSLIGKYLNKEIIIEGIELKFTELDLRRAMLVYQNAIDYSKKIYDKYISKSKTKVGFEISIDETSTPTTALEHYFVANELLLAGVKIDTIAPRFCGEFQKGIDYIGDLFQFENELKLHAAIARHFGYKLSIHSGSDKFSIFELIGKYTKGHFHVKTAGTNWLEAMKVVSICNPNMYRRIHKYALSKFNDATKFYHVTTDINKIPDVDLIADECLVDLFKNNDARQLIHITYGYILNEKDESGKYLFKTELYKLWKKEEKLYADELSKHIGNHLALLYKGFN